MVNAATSPSVFAKKEEYKELQEQVCKKFVHSGDSIVATLQIQQWDRFKRENELLEYYTACTKEDYERISN